MAAPEASTRAELEAISAMIESAAREHDPTIFFAVFMEMKIDGTDTLVYLANGDRLEIRRLLAHWVERSTFTVDPKRRPRETSEDVDVRLAVERRCADVGTRLTRASKVALFFFKNDVDCPGGVGVNAYFASLPNARNRVAEWLAAQEQRS